MAAENGTLRAFPRPGEDPRSDPAAAVLGPGGTYARPQGSPAKGLGLGLSGRGRGAGPEGKLHRDHAADRAPKRRAPPPFMRGGL